MSGHRKRVSAFHPDSSNVKKVVYDYDKEQMTITFKGDRTYRYSGVPDFIFKQIKQAESVGRYVNTIIVGNYPEEKL